MRPEWWGDLWKGRRGEGKTRKAMEITHAIYPFMHYTLTLHYILTPTPPINAPYNSALFGLTSQISGTLGTCGLFCAAIFTASLVLAPSLPSPPPPVNRLIPVRIRLRVSCLGIVSRLNVVRPDAYSSSEKASLSSSSAVVEMAGEMRWSWWGADGDVTERECRPGRYCGLLEGATKVLNAPGVMTPGSRAGECLTSGMKPDWKDVTLALRVSDFDRMGAVCWS